MRRTPGLIVAIITLGMAAGCGKGSEEPQGPKVKVVTTIPPLADFCRQVGGERVEVTNLLPSGASPHTFEPKPSQARAAQDADLVIRIGLDADRWVEGLLPQDAPVITATELEGIQLIAEGNYQHGEHVHQGANPHVWLDPLYAKLISEAIAGKLIELDPASRALYEKNLEFYLARLDTLHAEISERVENFANKSYVSLHPAFPYFARRYGLSRAAVIYQAPGKEPSPRHLDEVADAIKKTGVNAVFAEPQLSPKAARVIAREAGVQMLLLDPLGSQNQGYLALMRRNLDTLARGMGE